MGIQQNVGELCATLTIANQRGLHARAAAKFVKLVESFAVEITVTKDEMKVSGRSIMGLMMLAATLGSTIKICAVGDDAAAALESLGDLVKRKFDEE
ncbi:MAG: HPr family phosphocarrier protein [Alphaproteobacteria bacterium]|nr:HPr family phosphocarrier protein [Alphaproteobacteria bacterium]